MESMTGNDWTPPSPRVVSVFNVWETTDLNWRRPHYPCYYVSTVLVGSAFSLEDAERLVREVAEDNASDRWTPSQLHSIRVTEDAVGKLNGPWDHLSEYVYDRTGRLLDRRTVPNGERWCGRAPGEYRFRRGDLCEVINGDRVLLGIIKDVPPDTEMASRLQLDGSDDCYTIVTGPGVTDWHADSLTVFPPSFPVRAGTLGKLRRAFDEDATLPMRLRIADTTAMAQLRALTDELGWSASIRPPRWEGDTFEMEMEGVPGFPQLLHLFLDRRKAHGHMDRIRITFLRLAGHHPAGTGYRLRPAADPTAGPGSEPAAWML